MKTAMVRWAEAMIRPELRAAWKCEEWLRVCNGLMGMVRAGIAYKRTAMAEK